MHVESVLKAKTESSQSKDKAVRDKSRRRILCIIKAFLFENILCRIFSTPPKAQQIYEQSVKTQKTY